MLTTNRTACWAPLPKAVSLAVDVPFGSTNTRDGWMVVVGIGPGNTLITVEFELLGMIPMAVTVERVMFPEKPARLVRVMVEEACPLGGTVMKIGLASMVKVGPPELE